MSILSQDFVCKAITAEKAGEQFPIDFDLVWFEIGYSRKSDALNRLQSTHSIDEDYTQSIFAGSSAKIGRGRPRQKIYLTVDCLKSFCMVAETSQGREVRKYFIEIEKAYRAQLERQLLMSVRNELTNDTDYEITFWKVWEDSGIKSAYYVRDVIVGNYDYQFVNGLVCVNRVTYQHLIGNFRSTKGARIDELSAAQRRRFRRGEEVKKNRREPQKQDADIFTTVGLPLFDNHLD